MPNKPPWQGSDKKPLPKKCFLHCLFPVPRGFNLFPLPPSPLPPLSFPPPPYTWLLGKRILTRYKEKLLAHLVLIGML